MRAIFIAPVSRKISVTLTIYWSMEVQHRKNRVRSSRDQGRLDNDTGRIGSASQFLQRDAHATPVPKPARCPAREYGAGLSRFDRGPGPHPQRKTATAQAHAKR